MVCFFAEGAVVRGTQRQSEHSERRVFMQFIHVPFPSWFSFAHFGWSKHSNRRVLCMLLCKSGFFFLQAGQPGNATPCKALRLAGLTWFPVGHDITALGPEAKSEAKHCSVL